MQHFRPQKYIQNRKKKDWLLPPEIAISTKTIYEQKKKNIKREKENMGRKINKGNGSCQDMGMAKKREPQKKNEWLNCKQNNSIRIEYVEVSKYIGDLSWGWLEGSLFNCYYTKA